MLHNDSYVLLRIHYFFINLSLLLIICSLRYLCIISYFIYYSFGSIIILLWRGGSAFRSPVSKIITKVNLCRLLFIPVFLILLHLWLNSVNWYHTRAMRDIIYTIVRTLFPFNYLLEAFLDNTQTVS